MGERLQIYPGRSDERAAILGEDFGDAAGLAVTVGETPIVEPSRRWAVQLDDGSLIFADTTDLRGAG